MANITTEYRGHKITYSENADEWNCYEVRLSDKSLAKLKEKIDRAYLKLRKAAAFDCIELPNSGTYNNDGINPATIIEYHREVWGGGGWTGKEPFLEDHEVYAMAQRGENDRKSRQKRNLSAFAPDTQEVRDAIDIWRASFDEFEQARARCVDAFKAIPRVTIEDIEGLVKASAARIEEE